MKVIGAGLPRMRNMMADVEANVPLWRRAFPAERLLVWQPKEGWEPLCEFLDVPVPEESLPHINDTEAFKDDQRRGDRDALRLVGEAAPARVLSG